VIVKENHIIEQQPWPLVQSRLKFGDGVRAALAATGQQLEEPVA
jgi:hypothetical protein